MGCGSSAIPISTGVPSKTEIDDDDFQKQHNFDVLIEATENKDVLLRSLSAISLRGCRSYPSTSGICCVEHRDPKESGYGFLQHWLKQLDKYKSTKEGEGIFDCGVGARVSSHIGCNLLSTLSVAVLSELPSLSKALKLGVVIVDPISGWGILPGKQG